MDANTVYAALANCVFAVHVLLTAWAVFGGFLCIGRPSLLRWHVPVAVWGVLVLWCGWPCPLTMLEDHLRTLGGGTAYANGFLPHLLECLHVSDGNTLTSQTMARQLFQITAIAYVSAVARGRIDRAFQVSEPSGNSGD